MQCACDEASCPGTLLHPENLEDPEGRSLTLLGPLPFPDQVLSCCPKLDSQAHGALVQVTLVPQGAGTSGAWGLLAEPKLGYLGGFGLELVLVLPCGDLQGLRASGRDLSLWGQRANCAANSRDPSRLPDLSPTPSRTRPSPSLGGPTHSPALTSMCVHLLSRCVHGMCMSIHPGV